MVHHLFKNVKVAVILKTHTTRKIDSKHQTMCLWFSVLCFCTLLNKNIFASGAEPQNFTVDGIEQHMQVNHVAPALLTLLLLPSLLKAPGSRIINVNSVVRSFSGAFYIYAVSIFSIIEL